MEQETTHAIPKFYPNPQGTGLKIKPQRVPKRETQVFRFFCFPDKGVSTQNIPELPIPRSMMHCMGRQLSTAGKSMMHKNKKTDNSFELSASVAGGGLEPPTFGL